MRLGDLHDGAKFALAGSTSNSGAPSIWKVAENDGGDHVVVSAVSNPSAAFEGRIWLADMTVEPHFAATRIPGFVVIVSSLPWCDICGETNRAIENHARYNARTTDGSWAHLCPEHFAECTDGTLGVGNGQYLVPSEEMEAGGLLPEHVVAQIQTVAA